MLYLMSFLTKHGFMHAGRRFLSRLQLTTSCLQVQAAHKAYPELLNLESIESEFNLVRLKLIRLCSAAI
jgi:hypothetical protein